MTGRAREGSLHLSRFAAHACLAIGLLQAPSALAAWIGANAITLYLLNNIIGFESFAARLVDGDVAHFLDQHLTEGAGRFLAAATGLVLAIALAGFLYRRRIFLRV